MKHLVRIELSNNHGLRSKLGNPQLIQGKKSMVKMTSNGTEHRENIMSFPKVFLTEVIYNNYWRLSICLYF